MLNTPIILLSHDAETSVAPDGWHDAAQCAMSERILQAGASALLDVCYDGKGCTMGMKERDGLSVRTEGRSGGGGEGRGKREEEEAEGRERGRMRTRMIGTRCAQTRSEQASSSGSTRAPVEGKEGREENKGMMSCTKECSSRVSSEVILSCTSKSYGDIKPVRNPSRQCGQPQERRRATRAEEDDVHSGADNDTHHTLESLCSPSDVTARASRVGGAELRSVGPRV